MWRKTMNLNIGGAVVHYKKLIVKIPTIQVKNKDIHFTVFDGPNLCRWNGGRINRDITLTPKMVEMYNRFGISVAMTFTNPIIDMDDKVGNELLELLDLYGKKYNVRNKIILVNDNFRQYLRDNYDFILVYSISGHPSDIVITDEHIQRYKNLETLYDVIVPKFEVVFEKDWYDNIDPSKYELLINDSCIYACKHFHDHFAAIAEHNRIAEKPWEELGYLNCFNAEECYVEGFNADKGDAEGRIKHGEKMGMDYTPEMLKSAINRGFKSFKLAGRENKGEQVSDEITKFLEDIK